MRRRALQKSSLPAAAPSSLRMTRAPLPASADPFRDNQADGVLIESLEPAFALQILQMTRDDLYTIYMVHRRSRN